MTRIHREIVVILVKVTLNQIFIQCNRICKQKIFNIDNILRRLEIQVYFRA